MNICAKVQSPTEKQIQFAEKIANTFNIDFPVSSYQYNKVAYGKFIKYYFERYKEFIADSIDSVVDEDYLMDICENDVWCEHY